MTIRRMAARLSLLLTTTVCLAATGPRNTTPSPRVPMGVYSCFVLNDLVNSAQGVVGADAPDVVVRRDPIRGTTVTLAPADAAIVQYLKTVLDDPAIAGLAPEIGWVLLNPKRPGPNPADPLPGAYDWNPLDDVFIAVNEWNTANPTLTPKGIQLMVSPGFNSPPWVFDDIDAGVCGTGAHPAQCTGSCDGLFMTPYPSPLIPVSPKCGYTTLFYRVESSPIQQMPLPMPWNEAYKTDWQAFITALNAQIQREPSASAFVSIAMGGPTASSTEMILPNETDQAPYENSAELLVLKTGPDGVVPPGEKAVGFSVSDAWDALLHIHYAPDASYQNSEKAFIEEWDKTIDMYSSIFKGITLVLTTSTDALPGFPGNTDSSILYPAPGFSADCDPASTLDAMECAAVTQVLTHFVNPTVAEGNAKAIWECGMTARRDATDLGTNGVRWLSAVTAAGTEPLPDTKYDMSRMIGGMQFGKSFSKQYLQMEGCPTYPKDCVGLTPAEGLGNVVRDSYFVGTAAGPIWGESNAVDYAHWNYSNAAMNFLQIYSDDVIYAEGLSNCKLVQIMGDPATGTPPDLSACAAKPGTALYEDSQITNVLLDLVSLSQLSITEPAQP